MKCWNENAQESKNTWNNPKTRRHMLHYTLSEQLSHGMEVSNLAYAVARELGYSAQVCYELAVAGVLHDIGKIVLMEEMPAGDDTLVVEEIKFVRMHAEQSYEIVKRRGYSEFIQQSILYHHENYDGSGYPYNLYGEQIPFGARILRVCDVYSALTSQRPYRSAFDRETAMELMIEDIKDFDMRVFLAFQRVVHEEAPAAILPEELAVSDINELRWQEQGQAMGARRQQRSARGFSKNGGLRHPGGGERRRGAVMNERGDIE